MSIKSLASAITEAFAVAAKASVSYASCTILSSSPVTCPLCGIDVPPGEPHTCSSGGSNAPPQRDETRRHRRSVSGGLGVSKAGPFIPDQENRSRARRSGAQPTVGGRSSSLTAQELAQPRPIERATVGVDGRIEFRIQRELRNDNSGFGGGNRNAHWSKKHKKRQMWVTSMTNALVVALGVERARDLLVPDSGLHGARGTRCQERRRIEIVRLVPSRRRFVRDTFENLPWCAKELRDAIKHLGLIRDDSDTWTDTLITQDLSQDGTCWTWVAITPITEEKPACSR